MVRILPALTLCVFSTSPLAVVNSRSEEQLTECRSLLPEQLALELAREFRGWSIVTYEQLSEDDKEIWRESFGSGCPGVARIERWRGDRTAYAILLGREEKEEKRVKLVLVEEVKGKHRVRILREESVSRWPVVFAASPGEYYDFYDREIKVKISGGAFILAVFEAWADLIYDDPQCIDTLRISD
jgi:hypothetical protein